MAISGKKMALLLLAPPLFFAALVFGTLVFMLLLVTSNSPPSLIPEPTNVTPSEGLPPQYVRAAASDASGIVPLQYLAGEVETESGWDPHANANVNDPNSHAQGLLQFEPETWSGWSNPFSTYAEPDTDATRIKQYGGYGVDGDGLWEIIGTPAEESLAKLEASSRPFFSGYVPYASPYDPFDALDSGALYLSRLYRNSGGWSEASRNYYGGTNWYTYVQTVWQNTYNYLADTTPLEVKGGKHPFYFFLGAVPFTETTSGKFTTLGAIVEQTTVLQRPSPPDNYMPPATYRQTLENEFVTSVPLIAPASGLVRWKIKKNQPTVIYLPIGKGKSLRVSASQAVPWVFSRTGGEVRVKAGAVVGVVNLLSGVSVAQLSAVYPTLRVTGYFTRVVGRFLEKIPKYDAYLLYTPKYAVHDPWWPPS